jgi:hypothetical protein
MEIIRIISAGAPLRWWILASGGVAIGAQIWLLREALRRRKRQDRLRIAAAAGEWEVVRTASAPRPTLELVALAALLLLPIATLSSVARAQRLPPAASWPGQLTSISLGIVLQELVGVLAVVAWSFAFTSRRKIARLIAASAVERLDPVEVPGAPRFPGSDTGRVLACAASVCVLVLLPVLQGALAYCLFVTTRVGALAHAPAAERLKRTAAIVLEARRRLDAGVSAAQVGLALAAVTCGVMLWQLRSGARARAVRPSGWGRINRTAWWGDAVWAAAACVLLSMTLYMVSLPRRAESEILAPAGESASGSPSPSPSPSPLPLPSPSLSPSDLP